MCLSSGPSLPPPPPPPAEPPKPMVSAEASSDSAARVRGASKRSLRIDLAPPSSGSTGLNIPL